MAIQHYHKIKNRRKENSKKTYYLAISRMRSGGMVGIEITGADELFLLAIARRRASAGFVLG